MKALAFFSLALISISVNAQLDGPDIIWQRCFGGTDDDQLRDLHMTADNGFILIGYATSTDGQVSNNHGGTDAWVVKTDANGILEWERCYGGASLDNGSEIISTSEGGYLLLASTQSLDGDVSVALGSKDIWLVKLDPSGEIEWEKSYGGSGNDEGFGLLADEEGNYYVIGRSNSTDGMITENFGLNDTWLLKVDGDGLLLWERSLGGAGEDTGYSLDLFSNGDIGVATRIDLQISDVYIARYTASGDLVWGETYGGTSIDACNRIRIDSSDVIHISGHSFSIDGDLNSTHGGADVWHLVLDEEGTVITSMTYGGSMNDNANDLILIDDGGFIHSGGALSDDGDIFENFGETDAWVIRLDDEGNILWERVYGGSETDRANRVIRSGGSIILGGFTNSTDGDVIGNHGDFDLWLMKLEHDPVSVTGLREPMHAAIVPNPTTGIATVIFLGEMGQNVSIDLLDTAGRTTPLSMIRSSMINETRITLDLSDRAPGTYHVVIKGDRSPVHVPVVRM